jgi:anthranilate phosphoribosyltransferase
MSILPSLTAQLAAKTNLTRQEARDAALELARAEVSIEDKKEFLRALTKKVETSEEVAAFATAFRTLARGTGLDDIAPRAIDIVGTGGSGSGSYNISSVAAIVVATYGMPVIKHGNRAITSKSGAADFLSALGVPLTPSLSGIRKCIEELNFCFLFAPNFHPAFKEIGPVRKALAAEGQRTIFNILGPLINPAKPAYELLGVFGAQWVSPLAGALDELGLVGGVSVYGRLDDKIGMDEFSTAGENHVAGFGAMKNINGVWTPESLGFTRSAASELKGSTPDENVLTLRKLARGKGSKALIDTISLNAGAALWIAGLVPDLASGCAKAREILIGGDAAKWLEKADRVLKTIA